MKIARYGSWRSPITATVVANKTTMLSEICLDGDTTYWLESRPSESGRNVIVRQALDGECIDVTPPPFNVRTRAHEYGGGAWIVSKGVIYFSNDHDGRLYKLVNGSKVPSSYTLPGDYRYADGIIDHQRNLWIGVREDHTNAAAEPINALVAIPIGSDCPEPARILAAGHDFYSSPRLSPDGLRLAWLAWDHPAMPWNETTLYVAELGQQNRLGNEPMAIAGGNAESIFQPEWAPDGRSIYFVSDRSGWWNFYRYDLATGAVESLAPLEAEFGLPQWQFGLCCYDFAGPHSIICCFVQKGRARLGIMNTLSGALEEADLPFTDFWWVRANESRAVFRAGSAHSSPCIVQLDLSSRQFTVLRKSIAEDPDLARYLSTPQMIEFPTADNKTAFGFFYPPRNPDYSPVSEEKAPLLIRCHGGPTAETTRALDLRIHYWTSRGIAVFDVNYSGSSGFGREYRNRLRLNWGALDVADCVNGAKFLAEQDLIDKDRIVITGNSAGGYTALMALTQSNVFRGGGSHYGVTESLQFLHHTHKFESHYLSWLIGTVPEDADRYRERSPITHAAKLSCPVIFFAGEEDAIVPLAQTEQMAKALREQRTVTSVFVFSGEQHGFRKAETIRCALEAELYFYSTNVFGTDLKF